MKSDIDYMVQTDYSLILELDLDEFDGIDLYTDADLSEYSRKKF